MHLPLKRHSVVLIAAGMLLAASANQSLAQEFSAPEKLLFMSNHFNNVKTPLKLNYSYRQEAAAPVVAAPKTGTPDPAAAKDTVAEPFSDEVTLDIVKNNTDGTANVSSRFLSGDRAVPMAPIDNAQGNPVILGFLERDIAEMKKVTGGAIPYFRKRIRLALAEPDTTVKKIEVTYDGRKVPAQQITIFPYAKDPLKDRFASLGDKGYVFVISDQVPGSLFQVYTLVPVDKAAPAIGTSMTIAKGDTAAMSKAGLVSKKI